MKEIIFTEKATKPTAPYSQAIKCRNMIYLAGACGDDPKTDEIAGNGDMRIEASYCMENIKNTIEAAGGSMNDIVMVRVFVTDIDNMGAFNDVYVSYFKDGYLPARICMQVVKLAGGASLEVEAQAIIGE